MYCFRCSTWLAKLPSTRISSAIVQRYIDHILSAATSANNHIQSPAVDIISYTVKQGLAHPLQVRAIMIQPSTEH